MKNDITLSDLYPVIIDTLQSGKTYSFVPSGNSMYPLIHSGENEVTLIKADNLKVGDIVFVKALDDTFILHRLDEITEGGYILRGDNLLRREGIFTKENIIGKVISYKKSGKEKTLSGFRYFLYLKVRLPLHRYNLRLKRKLRIIKNGN